MKSTNYSEKVKDHFKNPRNVGTLEGENVAVGRVGNPVCGDLMDIYIEVKDGKIADIKFKTFGCGSAVATSSMVTELAKGKSLEEAMEITRQDVADELDGLPPIKMHCSNLAADALHEAIKNFKAGRGTENLEPGTARFSCPSGAVTETKGIVEYLGKGVYQEYDDLNEFEDKRVLIVEYGRETIELAINLTGITGRVVLMTPLKRIEADADLKSKLRNSDVKVLTEAELREIGGGSTVEKVHVHDLNEDEEYDLFVDAVIVPK
ncbi:MAG: iron-sulfur cluster assembly scaffold protein [Promethearchaeota archaeon]